MTVRPRKGRPVVVIWSNVALFIKLITRFLFEWIDSFVCLVTKSEDLANYGPRRIDQWATFVWWEISRFLLLPRWRGKSMISEILYLFDSINYLVIWCCSHSYYTIYMKFKQWNCGGSFIIHRISSIQPLFCLQLMIAGKGLEIDTLRGKLKWFKVIKD